EVSLTLGPASGWLLFLTGVAAPGEGEEDPGRTYSWCGMRGELPAGGGDIFSICFRCCTCPNACTRHLSSL
ncbi:hypothetical protein PMAYCL1PPCAC_27300, partial [Pristionchus mayeri]